MGVLRKLADPLTGLGTPKTFVRDNANELTSNAVLAWSNYAVFARHYIAPVKPTQNGFVESFGGRARRS